MRARFAWMGWVLALAWLASGCSTRLSVVTLEPAPVSFGAADRLSLTDVQARPDVRALVVSEVARQAGNAGWYVVVDRTGERMHLQPQGGDRVAVVGGKAGQQEGEILLQVAVTHWGVNAEVVRDYVEKEFEKDGVKHVKKVARTRRKMAGEVALQVTAAEVDGRAPLLDAEFFGSAVVYDSNDPPDTIAAAAAQDAIARLLATITPRRVRMTIELDDDDDRQERILELAEEGHVEVALGKMEAFAAAHPKSASAMHNLAALLDASGRYAEALPWYDRALASPDFKDYYARNRAGCLRRQAALEALSLVTTAKDLTGPDAMLGRWDGGGTTVRFDQAGTYTWQAQRTCGKPPCPSVVRAGRYEVTNGQIVLIPAKGREEVFLFRVTAGPETLWLKDVATGREWSLPRVE